MGFNEDLSKAVDLATHEMIDFLRTDNRDDAYMLTSVAVDIEITQLVDAKKGVHAVCPKAIFKAAAKPPMVGTH
jgi:acetamidase/formamidase